MKFALTHLAAAGILFTSLCTSLAQGASSKVSYFHCLVKEPTKGGTTRNVHVRFAVRDLDLGFTPKGTLISYPGLNEEDGAIFVTSAKVRKDEVLIMSNLNGQGGDLRLEGSNLRLFGDGDGYQFTDLVIWDADTEAEEAGKPVRLEGYVRDYGPAYGKKEATFKQFIQCERSTHKF